MNRLENDTIKMISSIERAIDLLCEGMQIDGAHHKQHYMHEALKLLSEKDAREIEEITGDIGIQP